MYAIRVLSSALLFCTFKAFGIGFLCEGKNTAYTIRLGGVKALEIVEGEGKKRRMPLSSANLGRLPAQLEGVLYYNGWDKSRKEALGLDFSTEVRIAYVVDPNTETVVHLQLIINDRPVEGLQCTTQGIAAPVDTQNSKLGVIEHARFFNQSTARQSFVGDLSEVGTLGVLSALTRMVRDSGYQDPKKISRFIDETSLSLKAISPASVRQLETRMPAECKSLWGKMLSESRYAEFPETLRYVAWIKEGSESQPLRNLNSVRAGFVGFQNSTLSKKKAIQELFKERVSPLVGTLDSAEIKYVSLGLSAEGTHLLHYLWSKKQLQAIPKVYKWVTEIEQRLTDSKAFDPLEIKVTLESFMQSEAFQEPDVRRHVVSSLSPAFRRLTPRKKEDILVWFNGKPRQFVEQLFL